MLDDMRMRRLNPKTQSAYIRAVCRFTRHLGRAPDTATVEDLRINQLHLVDTGTSPMSLNAAISGLKSSLVVICVRFRCVHAASEGCIRRAGRFGV
nr:phage integrase N-terminal SAM-like domain-containing protein [Thauera sp. SWB20]